MANGSPSHGRATRRASSLIRRNPLLPQFSANDDGEEPLQDFVPHLHAANQVAKSQGAPKNDLAQDAAASLTLRFGVSAPSPPRASVAWQYEHVAAAGGAGPPHDGQFGADGFESVTSTPPPKEDST